MPVLVGFVPVQGSGEVAEDGQQLRDLGHQSVKQPTPAGNGYHGPLSYDELPSSLLVKADAHVPNVPYNRAQAQTLTLRPNVSCIVVHIVVHC